METVGLVLAYALMVLGVISIFVAVFWEISRGRLEKPWYTVALVAAGLALILLGQWFVL